MPSLASSLNIALKEWDAVSSALAAGRQAVLLRKGGISETNGEFELEHRQFLLFPTFLHQNATMVKEEFRGGVQPHSQEPEKLSLAAAGVVTDIVQLGWRSQMDALDAYHIWTPPLIDMRFNYRPDRPLYLMLVRAYRLATPLTITNTPAYWGCKSWVPLTESIDTSTATPALSDDAYKRVRDEILAKAQ